LPTSEFQPPSWQLPCVWRSAAVTLYYVAYNAMAAGVTDRLWEVSDLVALLEADEWGLERAA
jgi:hypothetical protein